MSVTRTLKMMLGYLDIEGYDNSAALEGYLEELVRNEAGDIESLEREIEDNQETIRRLKEKANLEWVWLPESMKGLNSYSYEALAKWHRSHLPKAGKHLEIMVGVETYPRVGDILYFLEHMYTDSFFGCSGENIPISKVRCWRYQKPGPTSKKKELEL